MVLLKGPGRWAMQLVSPCAVQLWFSVRADNGVLLMLQMQQMAMIMQKQMHMQQQQAGMASDTPAHEQLQAMQAAQVCAAAAQARRLRVRTTKHIPEQRALCGTSVVDSSMAGGLLRAVLLPNNVSRTAQPCEHLLGVGTSVRTATKPLFMGAGADGRADGTSGGTRHGHEQAGLRAGIGHGQDALWASSR